MIFFFQAEDGIRDAQESRGLGDVYKRQGLTLNKSIEWLKNYGPTKDYIKEVKTACLWKKKSSTFEPDFCPVRLDTDPWIVQPTEHYEELSIEEIIKRN